MEMPRKITSLLNDLVKQWASLRKANSRHKEQLFLLEGPRLVDEALKSTLSVVAVCSSDSSWINDLQVPKACRRFEVTAEIIAKCCSTETPQTAFAVAELPAASTDFDWQTIEIAILLDRIQDPGNMGAILRAAAAVGVDVVVIGDGCVDLFAPKTLRAAMGATFRVPVVHHDLATVLPKLRKADCQLLASVLQPDATNLFRMSLHSKKVAWIVGNEGNGIHDSLLSEVDALVAIPMLRQTESLNVAQATAVLLYETARQKKSLTALTRSAAFVRPDSVAFPGNGGIGYTDRFRRRRSWRGHDERSRWSVRSLPQVVGDSERLSGPLPTISFWSSLREDDAEVISRKP